MKIAVIGGGVCGLSCAYYLSKKGYQVYLFEKDKTLGGLSSHFKYKDEWIDKYYHFICGEDNEYVNLLNELNLKNKIKSKITMMGYFYKDNIFSISTPFDLLRFPPLNKIDRIRYIYSLLYFRLYKNWKKLDQINSISFLKKISGENVYKTIWEPVLRGKFGSYFKDISAAWMLWRIKRVATSRAYFGIYEKMRYLSGGTKTFIDKIKEAILSNSGKIFENAKVEKIIIKNNRVENIFVNNTLQNFDKVITCIPAPAFLEITDNLQTLSSLLSKIKYIGVICAVVILKKSLTRHFWLNLNSPSIPFVNLVEYTNLDTERNKKIIYIPEYVDAKEERFNVSYEKLKSEYINCLKIINKNIVDDDIESFFVFRDVYAQPICNVGFRKIIPSSKTEIENLYFLDQSQLYPSDRTISGSIKIARELAKNI